MPATEAQSPRGYGLGLAFCRLAIEAHGGRIAVSPVAGGGNGFHFDLPGAPT
jgi:signal transduction histidine kinase